MLAQLALFSALLVPYLNSSLVYFSSLLIHEFRLFHCIYFSGTCKAPNSTMYQKTRRLLSADLRSGLTLWLLNQCFKVRFIHYYMKFIAKLSLKYSTGKFIELKKDLKKDNLKSTVLELLRDCEQIWRFFLG